VRLNIDKNKPETLAGLEDRINGVLPTRFYILAPDARVLDIIQPDSPREDLPRIIALLEKHARNLGVRAATPPRATDLTALASNDVLWYSASSRFLALDSQTPPAGRTYRYPSYPSGPCPVPPLMTSLYLRTQAPVTVREYLTPAQCKALLPPPAARAPGKEYTVPTDAAAQLVFQFRPPTHFNTPLPSDLSALSCQARVLKVDAHELEIALWGTMDAYDPWFPTPVQDGPADFVAHHGKCSFAGHIRVALPNERIQRLVVATDWGLFYGPDGTLLPYASTLEASASTACSLRTVPPSSKPLSVTGIDVPEPPMPGPTGDSRVQAGAAGPGQAPATYPSPSTSQAPASYPSSASAPTAGASPSTPPSTTRGGETLTRARAPGALPPDLSVPGQATVYGVPHGDQGWATPPPGGH
jgi:hypothetical protein